jgi:hypothetical protein
VDGAVQDAERSILGAPTLITDWTLNPSYPTDGGGGHVAYGNGIFVAAHWDDGAVSVSPNGTTWTIVTKTATTFGDNFIKYIGFLPGTTGSGSVFWAVGQGGKIATSSDGLTWTPVTQTLTNADIYGVAYAPPSSSTKNVWVFVTDMNDTSTGRSSIIYYDGGSWSAATNPVNTVKIDSVVYTGEKFAVGTNTGYITYTTTDLYTWEKPFQVNSSLGVNTNHFKMLAVAESLGKNGLIIAASRYGYAYAALNDLTQTGWSWTDVYPSASYSTHVWFNCVMFDGERFILTGQSGGMAYTSDGVSFTADTNFWQTGSWTQQAYVGTFINGIAFNGKRYVASGGTANPLGCIPTVSRVSFYAAFSRQAARPPRERRIVKTSGILELFDNPPGYRTSPMPFSKRSDEDLN